MTTLAQMLAIRDGVKNTTHKTVTEAHREVQKTPLLSGLERHYQPKDDEGDQLPGESTRVQYSAFDAILTVQKALGRMLDVQATVDETNTVANAGIVVDGEVLVPAVPVTFLLSLAKTLKDLRTFVAKLPTLDPAFEWEYSSTAGAWRTPGIQTTRTQKVPRNHVVAPATDKHPAQVQVYYEDVIVGTWTTIRYSGALPAEVVKAMLEQVDKLIEAVNTARAKANESTAVDRNVGDALLSYVFRPQTPR